jgi:acyl-CoA synthetase (NDP forming)
VAGRSKTGGQGDWDSDRKRGDRQLHLLSSLFNPDSVVIVGASSNPRKLSGRPLQFLKQHGFSGRIFLVNAAREEINGTRCYPSIDDLPSTPALALIVVPSTSVASCLAQCGRRGIRNAVVLSAGFEETSGGQRRANLLRSIAQKYDIHLVGPNCEGIWSLPDRTVLTFGSAASLPKLRQGPVSVLSQSGSVGAACVRRLQDLGVGCRYYVSAGNESVLSLSDYLDFLLWEGGSKVILMFIEGIRNGPRFIELARAAHEAGVRLVALKAGQTRAGRAATQGHTGKLSGESFVYSEVFQQVKLIEVTSLEDLVLAAFGLTAGRDRKAPRQRCRVAAVSISGGSRSLIIDDCRRLGVPLEPLSVATKQRLRTILPPEAVIGNPVDPTGVVSDDPSLLTKVVAILAADATTSHILVQFPNWTWRQIAAHLPALAQTAQASRKRFVAAALSMTPPTTQVDTWQRRGVLLAANTPEAVRLLSFMTSESFRRKEVDERVKPSRPTSGSAGLRDWAEAVGFLEAAGIPVAPWRIVKSPLDLTRCLMNLAFPLVAKVATGVAHKTEGGLVRLGLRDSDQVTGAVQEIWERVGEGTPLLLQQQVEAGVEALLGFRYDEDWGPTLVIGAGGVTTELWKDRVLVSLPASQHDVTAAMRRLRIEPLLRGFRGMPELDTVAFRSAALRLGRECLRLGRRVEVEINPLILLPKGRGVCAVDVLMSDVPIGQDRFKSGTATFRGNARDGL